MTLVCLLATRQKETHTAKSWRRRHGPPPHRNKLTPLALFLSCAHVATRNSLLSWQPAHTRPGHRSKKGEKKYKNKSKYKIKALAVAHFLSGTLIVGATSGSLVTPQRELLSLPICCRCTLLLISLQKKMIRIVLTCSESKSAPTRTKTSISICSTCRPHRPGHYIWACSRSCCMHVRPTLRRSTK